MAVAFPSNTPNIDAAGRFVLRAPWNVDANASYKCEAIEGFEAIADRGGNVLSDYYQPMNGQSMGTENFDASAAYEVDRNRNINIVTIMSTGGQTIHVPSSFIISYPNQSSVPYGRIVIAIDLGPLPSDYPLEPLSGELLAVAATYVGSSNGQIVVSKHVVPMAGFVDVNAAANLANARIEDTKDAINIYASKLQTLDENEKLKSKLDAMEELVKGAFS